MKQISKTLAEDIARTLTEKNRNKIEEYEAETIRLCIEKYNSKLDPKIVELLMTLPEEFVKKSGHLYIQRSSFYSIYIHLQGVYVYGDNNGIEDPEFYELIKARQKKAGDMESKLRQLRDQITETIYKLRSSSRIEKEFPEAFKLLPVTETGVNLPALQVTDLLKQIDNFPEN